MSPEPTPAVDPGRLVICGTCHHLRGPVPGGTDGIKQLCACASAKKRDAQPLWGGDFNTYAELCRCCGLVLLNSGSRWSVWFCHPCRKLVRALNEQVGRSVVPIGRHSIMNQVSLPAWASDTPDALAEFTDGLHDLFTQAGLIHSYAPRVVQRNLVAIGLDPGADLPLADYLASVTEVDLTPERAFIALLFSVRSADSSTPR